MRPPCPAAPPRSPGTFFPTVAAALPAPTPRPNRASRSTRHPASTRPPRVGPRARLCRPVLRRASAATTPQAPAISANLPRCKDLRPGAECAMCFTNPDFLDPRFLSPAASRPHQNFPHAFLRPHHTRPAPSVAAQHWTTAHPPSPRTNYHCFVLPATAIGVPANCSSSRTPRGEAPLYTPVRWQRTLIRASQDEQVVN